MGGIKQDTVYKTVTLFVPKDRFDTLFVAQPGDTVVKIEGRLKIVYVKLPGDSVYINGECDTVTIYKKVPYYIRTTIKTGFLLWHGLVAVAIAALLFFIAGRVSKPSK